MVVWLRLFIFESRGRPSVARALLARTKTTDWARPPGAACEPVYRRGAQPRRARVTKPGRKYRSSTNSSLRRLILTPKLREPPRSPHPMWHTPDGSRPCGRVAGNGPTRPVLLSL